MLGHFFYVYDLLPLLNSFASVGESIAVNLSISIKREKAEDYLTQQARSIFNCRSELIAEA